MVSRVLAFRSILALSSFVSLDATATLSGAADANADARQVARLVVKLDVSASSNLQFSANGRRFLTDSYDSNDSIQVWDVRTLKPVAATIKLAPSHYHAVLNADGSRLLIGTYRRKAILWDVDEGKELVSLEHDRALPRPLVDGNTDAVYAVAISPDGQTLATGGDDHTLRLWNLKGELLQKVPHEAVVWYASFSPDGSKILTRTSGPLENSRRVCRTRMWDVKTAKELWQHRSPSTLSLAVDWSGDGKSVAFNTDATIEPQGYDPQAIVCDATTGRKVAVIRRVDSWLSEVSLMRGGTELLVCTKGGPHIITLATGNTGMAFEGGALGDSPHAIVSSDNRFIAAVSLGGKAALFDTSKAEPIVRITTKRKAEDEEGNDRPTIAFSPDGRMMLVAHPMEALLEVWELPAKNDRR